ncbi:MAG: UvrD-helicase domain-containing protein, partial [Acidimicrobiia bacterium]
MPSRIPAELGRGVVVHADAEPPPPWAGARRVRIDEAAVAAPEDVVAELHAAWSARVPVVVELDVDPAGFRAPRSSAGELWELGAGHTPWHDRLHFLVWANNYDGRAAEPIWWWARKARRCGATEPGAGPGDVVLADGRPAWVDGGPRRPWAAGALGAAVVHAESVDLGSLAVVPEPVVPAVALAPDQLAAVAHEAGPARIVAPAGSGKTRVLTERLRHLLVDRGYEPAGVLALAYNKQAQVEMARRTPGLGARIRTLNAWGYELVTRSLGRRPEVLDERDVRAIVERLVPRQQRRVNTDPLARYLEGLSLVRLGLRRPEVVEEQMGDVPGLAAAVEPYRAELRRRGAIDFDEQVFLAAESLVRDGELRRAVQAEHRHLLVDELQDLTPAHVLLLRLVACPTYDVFGV